MHAAAETVRRRVAISGVVQGVGFRPFVWRRATRLGLAGWVENDAAGVVLEVQGNAAAVAAFLDDLASSAPPLASVGRIDVRVVPVEPAAPRGFAILATTTGVRATTHVPPDIAPCPACLAELADPGDRRHGYPFVNCTDCGPRFTIIESLPYDRERTSMRGFAMCPRCAAEYHDPADRRFHAEPVACPACGPVTWYADVATGPIPVSRPTPGLAAAAAIPVGDAAIEATREHLRRGGIVAIKGVGGYHLACDATSAAAVERLRDRKGRVGKPLAVMVTDVGTASRIATVSPQERGLLEGRERPVVLLRRQPHRSGDGPRLANAVAPGLDVVGVMLPPSPLHQLLGAGLPPLVMTSGNLAEEPIAHVDADATTRLAPLADAFLLHDRPIPVPCDDSVVRCIAGSVTPIRRARGYAPLPIRLAGGGPAVLAVGGELKVAICVACDDVAILGQHVGDVGTLETLDALDRTSDHLLRLFGVVPEAVVADLHPGYLSADWAGRFAASRGIPLLRVQHHEAHAAALLAEHGHSLATAPDGFIVVCLDGTGYGRDGTIQGGEFLVVSGGTLERRAHLRPFPLPGGDAAIRHPWRTACAVLHAAGLAWPDECPAGAAPSPADRELLRRQLERDVNCMATSSMGRLFDAVAALMGLAPSVTYEAEAALKLECLAAGSAWPGIAIAPYSFTAAGDNAPLVVDWRPTITAAVAALGAAVPAAEVAAGFHAATVRMIVDTCTRLRDRGAGNVVGLTGGVFQNALLVERALDALHAAGFEVLTHHVVPPNDGGLALGQALLARTLLARTRTTAADPP
jgi:hydrogenase maturation protein HypF